MDKINDISLKRLLVLTFIPAIGILIFYITFSVAFANILPNILALFLAILFVLIPIELGVILFANKKQYGEYGLKIALIYTKKISLKKYLISCIIGLFFAAIVFMLLQQTETNFLYNKIFHYIPEYLRIDIAFIELANYSKVVIIVTWVIGFILNGLLGPLVEELYFRGYLLPGISRFGKFSPVIIAVLFSLYHLFTPWQNITRIIAVLPYHYFVWKNQNIYIGIVVHCLLNSISMFMMLPMLFA